MLKTPQKYTRTRRRIFLTNEQCEQLECLHASIQQATSHRKIGRQEIARWLIELGLAQLELIEHQKWLDEFEDKIKVFNETWETAQ